MAEILRLTVLNMDLVPSILNQILVLRVILSIWSLNTNSIRNKFESLSFLIGGKVDIF